jgi:hypothetical protein
MILNTITGIEPGVGITAILKATRKKSSVCGGNKRPLSLSQKGFQQKTPK